MGDRRKVGTRRCLECGEPAEELSDYRRICDSCHKRVNEARSRPFIETSTQRQKQDRDWFDSHFDHGIVSRAQRAKEHDDTKRRERQEAIRKRKAEEMARAKKEKPDLPQYRYDRIVTLADKVSKILREDPDQAGEVVDEVSIKDMAVKLGSLLDVKPRVLVSTLAPYRGQRLHRKDREFLSIFLAGNLIPLRRGITPVAWSDTLEFNEWSLVFFRAVNLNYTTRDDEPGFQVEYLVMSGPLAGRKVIVGYRDGREHMLARKCGISAQMLKKGMKRQYLIGILCFGLVCSSPEWPPSIRRVEVNSGQKKRNKEIMKARLVPKACPFEKKPKPFTSCDQCPLGYKEDRSHFHVPPHCEASLHEKTILPEVSGTWGEQEWTRGQLNT